MARDRQRLAAANGDETMPSARSDRKAVITQDREQLLQTHTFRIPL